MARPMPWPRTSAAARGSSAVIVSSGTAALYGDGPGRAVPACGDTGGMAHRQGRAGLVVREDVESGTAELVGDPHRPGSWTLLVDGTPQSHVDLDDPEYLDFEYMRRLGHLADLAAPAGTPLRVLHLGAGGLTLARYIAATRPGSSQLAVESDAALAEFVRQRLPLPRTGRPGRAAAHPGGRRPGRAGQCPGRVL